jgi:hypothetical protein
MMAADERPQRIDQFGTAIDNLANFWLDIDEATLIFRFVRLDVNVMPTVGP